MKLFKVTLDTHKFKPFYVVAETVGIACDAVDDTMRQRDWGFESDRVLRSVELIAEEGRFAPQMELIIEVNR